MQICIDDGSTSIKMAWNDAGRMKTFISENAFARGDAILSGDRPALTYVVGNDRYHYNPGMNAETTTNVEYQYSTVNAVAVQHALQKSGLKPQEVDIIATLPLTEFYTRQGVRNEANVERKISNLAQSIKVIGGETFTIRSVKVVPESIPAGIDTIRSLEEGQSLLIIDIGGTTLDLSLVGAGGQVLSIVGHEGIGVSTITNAVQDALQGAHLRASAKVVNTLIAHHGDSGFIDARTNTPAQVEAFKKTFSAARDELCGAVLAEVNKVKGYTHVTIVGGGASLIADAVRALPQCPVNRFTLPGTPQLALVKGIYSMFGDAHA